MGLEILALVLLLVPVLAKYSGVAKKGLTLIAGAGVSLLLAEGFAVFWTTIYLPAAIYGALLFQFIAWILLLVGAVLAIVEAAKSAV